MWEKKVLPPLILNLATRLERAISLTCRLLYSLHKSLRYPLQTDWFPEMAWSLEKKKIYVAPATNRTIPWTSSRKFSYCTHYVTSNITLWHVCGILQQFMGPNLTSGQRSTDKDLRVNDYHKIPVLLTSVVTHTTQTFTLV